MLHDLALIRTEYKARKGPDLDFTIHERGCFRCLTIPDSDTVDEMSTVDPKEQSPRSFGHKDALPLALSFCDTAPPMSASKPGSPDKLKTSLFYPM